ncbi:MAG: DUF2892 domain-containing protein [ANME-2 cluster archaeon]|nr:DUF2892 domain-containing protein [ANME-2 cluster archaeon]
MELNECTADRVIRVILGIVLLYVGAVYMGLTGIVSYIVVLLGLLLLVTGIIGFCPLYTIVKFSTCKVKP